MLFLLEKRQGMQDEAEEQLGLKPLEIPCQHLVVVDTPSTGR
jgi:hypothetical protein